MNIVKCALVSLVFAASSASAVVLDFDAVTNGTIASFSEDGYDVVTSGFQVTGFGNPNPSLASQAGSSTATIVQAGGGTFQFIDYDLADGGTGDTAGLTVEGFLGAALQYSLIYFPTDAFLSVASPSLAAIDSLVFTNDAAGGWVNIDNVRVEAVDVPEPATIALLGLGVLGMGFARRSRKA